MWIHFFSNSGTVIGCRHPMVFWGTWCLILETSLQFFKNVGKSLKLHMWCFIRSTHGKDFFFFFFSLQATVSFLNIWNVWSSLLLWCFQGAPKENIALKLVNIMMEMRLSNQILTCLCRTLLQLRLRNEHNLNQGTQETKDKNLWSVWLDCNRQFLHTHHRVVWSFLREVPCKNQSL